MSPAPQAVSELVERFARNVDRYRRADYNETQVRREYIDPLFEALGWDVANRAGVAPQYQDVIHEATVRVQGQARSPDYCFRIGPQPRFFVEAKKPSVDIEADSAPAYQLRRYAWTAKLPLSILTDFEEFSVYDCRFRPNADDRPSQARIMYITYEQYVERWDEVVGVFGREAVLHGDYDRYAETTQGKRGTQAVDDEFLAEIENWRMLLARNIALRNDDLGLRELNYAVQKIIDRILFLRICEDRQIEPEDRLKHALEGKGVYARLVQLFRQADDRYNSGLFHFAAEAGRGEAADEVTPGLTVDDKTLREIIGNLYYPQSPYAFAVMGADVLGSVYERFLGSVISLTAGHRAKVEQKPEVRKAGGVYYTPRYIVDYIVEHTVGELCQGRTPGQISRLRFLDPACGSGSFLLGAYQYLLDYHLNWYVEHPTRRPRDEIYQTANGMWALTTEEKRRILLNNIYGVDIDTQAVEVTKLSLLLKVLEGESEATLGTTLQMFHERALPDLANNVKCGNSLIGTDIYQQMTLLGGDELERINPFDWETEFPEIMGKGGFDAVIGNPPYGFHEIHTAGVKQYLKSRYAATHGSFEHYFVFYEASLGLMRTDGMHGFIAPVTWLTIPSAKSLRKYVLDGFWLREIRWLPGLVFRDAQVNTLVSIIQRSGPGPVKVSIWDTVGFDAPARAVREHRQSSFVAADYYIAIFEDPAETDVLEKMLAASVPLGQLARPCSGYNP